MPECCNNLQLILFFLHVKVNYVLIYLGVIFFWFYEVQGVDIF